MSVYLRFFADSPVLLTLVPAEVGGVAAACAESLPAPAGTLTGDEDSLVRHSPGLLRYSWQGFPPGECRALRGWRRLELKTISARLRHLPKCRGFSPCVRLHVCMSPLLHCTESSSEGKRKRTFAAGSSSSCLPAPFVALGLLLEISENGFRFGVAAVAAAAACSVATASTKMSRRVEVARRLLRNDTGVKVAAPSSQSYRFQYSVPALMRSASPAFIIVTI